VLAAKRSIVTVEEIVDNLEAWPNACVLPAWVVSRVCLVPRGASPSYADSYYARDNRFYKSWDAISRSRETFEGWIEANIHQVPDFAAYCQGLDAELARGAK
jgi:glutaconate CoA-transferase subunit A